MTAQLFRLGRLTGQWTNAERSELQAVLRLIRAAGQDVDLEEGISDEGDPWCVFFHGVSGEVIAHVARIEGRYVLDSMAFAEPLTGRSLRDCAARFIDDAPLPPPRVKESGVLRLHPGALVAGLFLTLTLFVQSRIEPSPFGPEAESGAADSAQGSPSPLRAIASQILDFFDTVLRNSERHADAGGTAMIPVAAIMAGIAMVTFGAEPPETAALPGTPPEDTAASAELAPAAPEAVADNLMLAQAQAVPVPAPETAERGDHEADAATVSAEARVADAPRGATPPARIAATEADSLMPVVDTIRTGADHLADTDPSAMLSDPDGARPDVTAAEPTTADGAADETMTARATTETSPALFGAGLSRDWRTLAADTYAGAMVDAVVFRDTVAVAAAPAPAAAAQDSALPLSAPTEVAPDPAPAPVIDQAIAAFVFQFVRTAGEIYIFAKENGIHIYDSEILEGFDRGKHVVREIEFSDDSVITLTGFESDFIGIWV